MRAIMLMFDTLTKNYLPNYGCDFVVAPNFVELGRRCTTFDNFYGGSMPCMPARRELHTGKYNFVHRGWGPLEPFDFSSISALRKNGVYTHLITDHSHYFEDGGSTYHNRYSTYEFFRGQEGDRWVPQKEADLSLNTCTLNKKNESAIQHFANRSRITKEEEMPSVMCVSSGIDFIEHYKDEENWFLQIECFDPHEPFYVPDTYRKLYDCCDSHEAFNFPAYAPVGDKYSNEDIKNLRKEYCALLSMCDVQVGRVIEIMDKYDMWKDTMLIVNTDHGFFLGEHEFIGKNFPPMYDEMVHIPFFIHDPRNPHPNERRNSLAQTIDIAPTLLNLFNVEYESEMDGTNIQATIENDEKIHDTILYGIHGGQMNINDGTHIYMRSNIDKTIPSYNWTMMPTNMRDFFPCSELNQAVIVNGGRYANNNMVMQIPAPHAWGSFVTHPNVLYNIKEDPNQLHPIQNTSLEKEMCEKMEQAMRKIDAPLWQFERFGFKK